MLNLCVGQLVESTAGRDNQKKFIIVCIISEQYVYISDGNLRNVEKPKRKKIKHLKSTGYISTDIKNKIESKKKVTNNEIRNFIKSINISRTGGLITLCQNRM